MKDRTLISKAINETERKAQLDRSCKKLLSFKIILAHILKNSLREFGEIDVNDIAGKYIEGMPSVSKETVNPDEGEIIKGENTEAGFIDEGVVRYDILFNVLLPSTGEPVRLIINIEAQNRIRSLRYLFRRASYYCSRMISAQYGREFKNDEYDKIRKVVSIWIVMNPYEKMRNTFKRIKQNAIDEIGSYDVPPDDYDTSEIVILGLGSENEDNYTGLLKMLGVLLSDRLTADKKKEILENEYNIEMTEDIKTEVFNMCDYSDYIYEKGILKGITEGKAAGRAEGKAEGRAEGRAEGKKEGKEETLLNSIKNIMDSLSVSLDRALEILKIPKSDYSKYEEIFSRA